MADGSDIGPAIQNLRESQQQLDMDGIIVGVSRQALEEVLAEVDRLRAQAPGWRTLTADEVEWVTNDIAELGVKIGNQFFFLYKGESLVYEDPRHEGDGDFPEGAPMMWRPVFKREFGECCHPLNHKDPRMIGTVSLDDSDEWQPLPSPPAEGGM